MVNEGSRLDYLNKEILKMRAIRKNIVNLDPYDYRLKSIDKKIEKLEKEKNNWETLYASINEMDLPPAEIRHYVKPNSSVVSQKNIQDAYILAATLWGEARGEGEKGMKAVMNVIMNRSKGNIDKAVQMVLKPKQFSFWNDKTDPRQYSKDLAKKLRRSNDKNYLTALKIVDQAMKGMLDDITFGAQYYFNPKLANPSWAKKMIKTATIGNHDFYTLRKRVSENIIGLVKTLITEGAKEKAVEDFIKQTIKGTYWEGKVFIAGGYVRDEFMGKDPKDLDLLVNAFNGGIEFAKWITKKVGAYRGGKNEEDPGSNPVIFPRFGTAKFNLRGVVHNGIDLSDMDIEAVMPRKEQYTAGSRKPTVTGGELKDDVERRDFTVNSLLKDLSTGEILDLTGMGKADIKAGIIRTPLNPDKIFTDDPLRMLRAIRFAVKYNWKLPMFMLRGLKKNASQLQNISQERIRDELNKMLVTGQPDKAIELLRITGLISYVVPELLPLIKLQQNIHHKYDAFKHTMEVLKNTQPVLVQRLIGLFHDIGKAATKSVTPTGIHFYGHEDQGAEIAARIMSRLKYPSDLIQAVVQGVKNHMRLKSGGDDSIKLSDKALRRFKFDLGSNLEDVLNVIHADNISHSDESSMPNQIEKVRQRLKAMDIKTDKPKLPIDGRDLIAMGLKPGPVFTEILKAITEMWLENPNITKDDAMALARNIVSQKKPLTEISQEEYDQWRTSNEYKVWRKNWLERHGAKFDDRGRVIAYHGTTPQKSKSIRQTGFRNNSYFTLNPTYARHRGRKVLEVHLPIDAIDFVGGDMVVIRPIKWEEVSDEPSTLTEAYDLPPQLASEAEKITKAAVGWIYSPVFRAQYLRLDQKEKQHDAVMEGIRKFPKVVRAFHEKAKKGSERTLKLTLMDSFSWETLKHNIHHVTVTMSKDAHGSTRVTTNPRTDFEDIFWEYGEWADPQKDNPELAYKKVVEDYEKDWEDSKKYKGDYIYGFVSSFRTAEQYKNLAEPYALMKNPLSSASSGRWKLDTGYPYIAAFKVNFEGKDFLFYFNVVKTPKDIKVSHPDHESGDPENPYVYMTLVTQYLTDFRGLDENALERTINTAKHETIHVYQDIRKPGIATGMPKEPLLHKHAPAVRGTTRSGQAEPGSPHIEKDDEYNRVVHAYRDVEFKSNLYNMTKDFERMLGENLPRGDWEKGFRLLVAETTGAYHRDWEARQKFKQVFKYTFTWEISTARKNLEKLYQNDRPKFRQYVKEIYKLLFISPRNV